MGAEFSSYHFNTITTSGSGSCRKGICTSGISYAYTCDALECGTGEAYKLLKIATAHPFPEKLALEFLEGSSSETIIVKIAGLISQHGILPAIVAGLILAGILAATMSTADSQMLAAASSVSQNIVQDFFHAKLSEKQSLLIARIAIVVISVVGVFLARDPNSSVFKIVPSISKIATLYFIQSITPLSDYNVYRSSHLQGLHF